MTPSQMVQSAPSCRNGDCHGVIVPTAYDGRFRSHRNILINVPKDFVILTCTECRKDYFTEDAKVAYTAMLENEFQHHAALIADIIAKHRKKALAAKDAK